MSKWNTVAMDSPVAANNMRARLEEAAKRVSVLAERTQSVADSVAGPEIRAVGPGCGEEKKADSRSVSAVLNSVLQMLASVEDNVARIDNAIG